MKAIVHIGTEKTGTTSIQEFLYQNRKKLKSAGYHFIQSAGQRNNRVLPAYCISDDQPDDFFRENGIKTLDERNEFKRGFIREFESEIHSVSKDIHTFIISSEHFHSRIRSEADMDNVYMLLSTYFDEFKIVCYLREQASTCTSSYSTHMKTGGTESFDTFMRRCIPMNYFYNYHDFLANWERCFGSKAMDVSLFAQARFLNGDLLDDFTAKINPVLVGTLNKPSRAENESLKPIGQALARAVNITFPVKSGRPEAHKLRDRCKKAINEEFPGKGQQPSLSTRKVIYDSFTESNERVRQKYFPHIENLFPPPSETTQSSYTITQEDFQGVASIFNVLKKHGKGAMLDQEYATVCSTIFSCISDVTQVVTDENEEHSMVDLNQDDIILLLCAAGSIKGRNPKSAFELVALVHRIFPNSPGVKEKLEEYRQRVEQAPKRQFLVTYHEADAAVNQGKPRDVKARFEGWIASLDVPEGSPLTPLSNTSAFRADGPVAGTGHSPPVAFSLFYADSLDHARAIVNNSPYLELGGMLEVSEVVPMQIK